MTVLLEYLDLSHTAYQTLRKAGHKSLTGTWPSRPTLATSLFDGDYNEGK